MGKKTEIVALPTKMLAVELGSNKRWKRIGAIGVVVGAAVAVAVVFVVRTADQREAAALDASWSNLNGCLLGEPLKDGETPAGRVGAVQLAVLGTPKDQRGKAGEAPWPAACAPYAFALGDSGGAAEANGAALAEAAQTLGKALQANATATADMGPLVEKTWAAATAAKLKPAGAGGGVKAPKPAAQLFPQAAFIALPKLLSGNFALASVSADASADDGKTYLLIDAKEAAKGPALCAASGADAAWQCMKVPDGVAKLSPGLRLIGTTDPKARPFFFAGDRGQLGIFPPDGKDKVGAAVTLGAVARADGSLLALTRAENAKDVKMLVAPPTGAATERPGLSAADVEAQPVAGLFWEWLVYKAPGKAGAPAHLMARKLPDGPGIPGAAIDVGEIAVPGVGDKEKEAPIGGCRSSEATAVRVRGGPLDTVAIFAGGRWSAPMKTATRGGSLSCRGVEAVTTEVKPVIEGDRNFALITQSRCNASGCTTATVNLREIFGGIAEVAPIDAQAVAAADVNGKLLLVWNAGVSGGVRMRYAAVDQMKVTPDVVINDGRDATGASKLGTVGELRVISSGTSAVVLLGTTGGVKALRLDSSGGLKGMAASL